MHSHGDNPRADILVISGLPGTGKTKYTDWLMDKHQWGCVRSDDLHGTMSPEEKLAFRMFANHDDRPLFALASGHPAGFAVEWGFHIEALNLVEDVVQRGFNAWYFDGDRDAAKALWLGRQEGGNPEDFDRQADSLRVEWPRISAIYGAKILRTVEQPPRPPLSPPAIHERLFGLP